MNENEAIVMTNENGEEEFFYAVEDTVLAGISYLLVESASGEDEEGTALILKDVSAPVDEEACYVVVEDDKELAAVASIFEELLDDIDLE